MRQKYVNHPQYADAMCWAAYEGLILNLLDIGRKEQAAQQVEEYTAKYAGKPEYMSPDGEHAGFVPDAQQMVERLQERGLMDEALLLAERLIAGQDRPTMESIKTLAVSRIKAGKLAEATAATEKLLKDYPMDEAGAMAVVKVATALRKSGQMDTAMGLYEYVMGIAKGTKAEALARAGRMAIWIARGQNDLIVQETGAIFADVPKDRTLSLVGDVLASVAEQCQDKFALSSTPPTEEELNYPIQFYEGILLRDPNFVPQPKTGYFLALCYQRLNKPDKATRLYNNAVTQEPALAKDYEQTQIARAGDRYCGAYVVWHLMKYYGKSVSVDEVSNRMGIFQKGYATIKDIVAAFKYYDIDAQAVQIPAEKAALLKSPFVQYRITAGIALGHFVLCIPDGTGKAVVLDGTKTPYVIDLSAFGVKDEVWDGTIVMIGQSREEFIGKLVSAQIDWKTMMAMGQCWMNDSTVSSDCAQITGIYYAELNEKKLACIKGGCSDLDCVPNGQTCDTNQPCENASNCPLALSICDDHTLGKRCMVGYGGYIPCITDNPHNCFALQRLTGFCVNGWCEVYHRGDAFCGNTTVPQCHDGWW